MIEDYKLTEEQKLTLLPPDELSKKGVHCLIDNLGFLNAQEFVASLMQEARQNTQTYEEWSEEFYGNMTDEEFKASLNEFIKNHPHE